MFRINFDPATIADQVRQDIRRGLSEMGQAIRSQVITSKDFKGGEELRAATRVEMLSDSKMRVSNDEKTMLYLEEGTKPHPIDATNAPFLVFQVDGRTIQTKHVNHPGTKATHTIESAAQAQDLTDYL